MNHGYCSTVSCFQRGVQHTQQQEYHLIGSFLNFWFGPAAQAQAAHQLWWLVWHLILFASYGALLVMVIIVAYANFGHRRITLPSLVVYTDKPENYL